MFILQYQILQARKRISNVFANWAVLFLICICAANTPNFLLLSKTSLILSIIVLFLSLISHNVAVQRGDPDNQSIKVLENKHAFLISFHWIRYLVVGLCLFFIFSHDSVDMDPVYSWSWVELLSLIKSDIMFLIMSMPIASVCLALVLYLYKNKIGRNLQFQKILFPPRPVQPALFFNNLFAGVNYISKLVFHITLISGISLCLTHLILSHVGITFYSLTQFPIIFSTIAVYPLTVLMLRTLKRFNSGKRFSYLQILFPILISTSIVLMFFSFLTAFIADDIFTFVPKELPIKIFFKGGSAFNQYMILLGFLSLCCIDYAYLIYSRLKESIITFKSIFLMLFAPIAATVILQAIFLFALEQEVFLTSLNLLNTTGLYALIAFTLIVCVAPDYLFVRNMRHFFLGPAATKEVSGEKIDRLVSAFATVPMFIILLHSIIGWPLWSVLMSCMHCSISTCLLFYSLYVLIDLIRTNLFVKRQGRGETAIIGSKS